MADKNKVICLKSSKIDFLTILKIKLLILMHNNCKIALDMKFVKDIQENFLQLLKKQSFITKISLFNLDANIMAILGIRQFDKYVYIYADESDYEKNTRSIVNRKFKVV